MTATRTKPTEIPHQKIFYAVKRALPRGRTFDVKVQDSALGGMKVVRVVTSAWKTLRPAERISRVRKAVEKALSQEEQDKILRFSVLTPDEYKALLNVPHHGRTGKTGTRLNAGLAFKKTGVRHAKVTTSGAEPKKFVKN